MITDADGIDTEVVKEQLDNLRNRLLDYTTRNDLLNHTHSERSTKFVRIVDELPNELYDKLVNGRMEFKPLPEIDSEPKSELEPLFLSHLEMEKLTNEKYQKQIEQLGSNLGDEEKIQNLDRALKDAVREQLGLPQIKRGKNVNPAEHAKRHGFNPDYDLPKPTGDLSTEHSDNFIQTLFVPDRLDRRLRSVYSKYQQFIGDTGINVLRGAFGYLEWFEEKNSQKKLHAPLLMLPLSMERTRSPSGARFFVSSAGQEAELNQTLVERMKSMDVALPDYDEDETPESYFSKVEPLIALKTNWRIRRFVTIGIFPFQKISMFKDLDPAGWPGDTLLGNNILATLLGGLESGAEFGGLLDEYDVDKLTLTDEIPPLYMSADSSQHSAIVDVLEGKNLVIQGPPGTGKSQTIANIIAAAMSKKKKVLFVAEKQAALNVVAARLRAAGLGPSLLDLHKRNDKTSLHQAIQENVEARTQSKDPSSKGAKSVLKHHLAKFQKHKELLHNSTNFCDISGYELFWKYLNYKILIEKDYQVGEFAFDGEVKISQEQLDSNLSIIDTKLADDVPQDVKTKSEQLKDFNFDANPIAIEQLRFSSNRFVEISSELSRFFAQEEKKLKTLIFQNTTSCLSSLQNLYQLKYLFDNLQADDATLASQFPEKCNFEETLGNLKSFLETLAAYNTAASNLPKNIKPELVADDYSVRELRELRQKLAKKGLFSRLSSERKEAIAQANIIGLDTADTDIAANYLGLLADVVENLKLIQRKSGELSEFKQVRGLDTKYPDIDALIYFCEKCISFQQEIEEDGSDEILREGIYANPEAINFVTTLEPALFDDANSEELEGIIQTFLDAIGSDEEPISVPLDAYFDIASVISGSSNSELAQIASLNMSNQNITWPNLSKFFASERIANFSSERAQNLYIYLETEARLRMFASEFSSELSEMNGTALNELRRKFAKNDGFLMNEEADKTLHKILNREIPMGNSKGLKSTFTDWALLKNEMSKKRAFIPIRSLIKRAAKALTAMKPIWMMSPLAISQFLERKPGQFDLLIIDEASQMKPEDALPAILRAKQIVVVGDNKQLPPTSFFDSSLEATDIDEQEDIQQESILDLAADRLANTRTLRWHYRSRHPDLIRFSNKRFYDNKLLIFPSPQPNSPDMGIRYIDAQGIYKSSLNQIEGQRVVEEAITHMANNPEKSLAIVAMNIKQKDYIRELFEYELNRNKVVSDYYENWKDNELEPFIIRNLESIQGDERDVIIVSTVYGPNEHGQVRQDFGPINRYYGPRRLNVLFSRAKEKLVLVTSLKPGDIKLDDSQGGTGKAALQEYISFASTGILDIGEETEREPDSDFEIAVIRQLKDHGYEAIPQVGVDGFRLDIGVKHPDFPYGFIAGVECDGATYHSSRSARDRDKIRQDILEGLGWKIYRIWSTDWFLDHEKETQRMIEQLAVYKEAALEHVRRASQRQSPKRAKSKSHGVRTFPLAEDAQKLDETVVEFRVQKALDEPKKDRVPYGQRKELQHENSVITYYVDNAEYFEVWEDDIIIGEIEKTSSVNQRAVLYGGTIQGIEKPRYECQLLVPDDTTKNFDDIFKALKWIYDSYKSKTS